MWITPKPHEPRKGSYTSGQSKLQYCTDAQSVPNSTNIISTKFDQTRLV